MEHYDTQGLSKNAIKLLNGLRKENINLNEIVKRIGKENTYLKEIIKSELNYSDESLVYFLSEIQLKEGKINVK